MHEVLPDGPTRRDLFRAAGAGAVLSALSSFFPRAGIAEVVENVLPRGRTRQTIHRDPRYYPLRNHLLDFLVTRSKRYRNGAAQRSGAHPPVRVATRGERLTTRMQVTEKIVTNGKFLPYRKYRASPPSTGRTRPPTA